MLNKQENEEITQLAQCLKDFLDLDKHPTNPYSILFFISNQTLINLEQNKHVEFSSLEIALSVGNTNSEPSAWISQPWKKIHTELKPKLEKSLSEFALKKGLSKYPWVAKIESPGGAGNQAYYYLIGLPIDMSILPNPDDRYRHIPFDIEYTSVQNLEPSWLAKQIFDESHSATGISKWILVFYPLAEMIVLGLFILIFILAFDKTNHPINSKDLVYALLTYLAFLGCRYNYQRSNIFFDDRLIMASNYFLSLKENFVVQELVTVNDNEGNFLFKKVQLVKYVSVCKVCGSKVVLDKGEPNFPRRIIGKCYENPTEHVYSFDRITKKGIRLN